MLDDTQSFFSLIIHLFLHHLLIPFVSSNILSHTKEILALSSVLFHPKMNIHNTTLCIYYRRNSADAGKSNGNDKVILFFQFKQLIKLKNDVLFFFLLFLAYLKVDLDVRASFTIHLSFLVIWSRRCRLKDDASYVLSDLNRMFPNYIVSFDH